MICIDAHHDGGTTPQLDDYQISLIGHSISGLQVRKGAGLEWNETTDFNWGADLVIVNNISPSPHLSTPHWVCEFQINATWCDLLNDYAIRVSAYDASGGGNQVWPNSTSGVPDDWGQTITIRRDPRVFASSHTACTDDYNIVNSASLQEKTYSKSLG